MSVEPARKGPAVRQSFASIIVIIEGGKRVFTTRQIVTHYSESSDEFDDAAPAPAKRSYPLLARIPDVSPAVVSAPPPRRTAAGHAAEYRFDPPQPRPMSPGRAAPSARARRNDERLRPRERALNAPQPSKVLPTADAFAIPTPQLSDAVAPVGRFLLLFALFTAAGTSLLMINRSSPPEDLRLPSAAAVDPAIAVPTGGSADTLQASPAQPTAVASPSLPPASSATQRPLPPLRVANGGSRIEETNHPEEQPLEPRQAPAAPSARGPEILPYPSTNVPPAVLPDSTSGLLPQVRASDAAATQQTSEESARGPAVARFSGEVQHLPPR